MLPMIAIIALLLVFAMVCWVWKLVQRSKLHTFNHSSVMFRILYALYTSSCGQSLHEVMISLLKYLGKHEAHTEFCTGCDTYGSFSVSYVPFMVDNFAFFIIDKESGEVAVVDPADPELILKEFHNLHFIHSTHLKESTNVPLRLVMVLCTHYHMDHAGGNKKLQQIYPEIRIISGNHHEQSVACQNIFAHHGDVISLGQDTHIRVLDTPCHTTGHVAFYVTSSVSAAGDNNPTITKGGVCEGDMLKPSGNDDEDSASHPYQHHPVLFTGDTLFVGGCGKFFEGNGKLMESTLYTTLRSLPKDTRIYCGHEYTVSNLEFGAIVEPDNLCIRRKLGWARERRELKKCTLPSTLAEECDHNVYLRADCPEVINSLISSCNGGIDKYHDRHSDSNHGRGVRSVSTAADEYGSCESTNDTQCLLGSNSMRISDVLEVIRRWKDTKVNPLTLSSTTPSHQV